MGDAIFEPIATVKVYNREELFYEEGKMIDAFKENAEYVCVNKQRPSRTKYEYYEAHKKRLKEKAKANRCIKVKCECGIETRKDNLSKHKKSQAHKDRMDGAKKKSMYPLICVRMRC